tara:strand:+ start:72 stop:248 length:177 start_codon:yes stop_codon:yes gene_type:complete
LEEWFWEGCESFLVRFAAEKTHKEGFAVSGDKVFRGGQALYLGMNLSISEPSVRPVVR